jgi:hypothetical protein
MDGWGSGNKSRNEQGKQIKCLIAAEGWKWMPTFDRSSPAVRQRLSESRFNMCAACTAGEAHRVARERGVKLTDKIYIETIEAIEHEMEWADE